MDLNTSIEKGIIDIIISSENNRLLVEITDNGSGFTTNKKAREYPSRATQIIKDRLLITE
jgi:two-component sensor histidine kinase